MLQRNRREWPRALLLGLAIAPAIAGCAGKPMAVGGRSGTQAVFSVRTLEATLESVPVEAAAAAAQAALRDRGYTIRSSSATPDRARIVAVPYDASMFEQVVVSASGAGGGSVVRVRVDPLGDQALSHAILDAMLARLGR